MILLQKVKVLQKVALDYSVGELTVIPPLPNRKISLKQMEHCLGF
jgi:hypothetical protein